MPESHNPDPEPSTGQRDLGFGSVVSSESHRRLLNRDGTFNVVRRGLGYFRSLSAYHTLIDTTWPRFLGLCAGLYLAVNAAFAAAFVAAGPGALAGAARSGGAGRFLDGFFFSVQTFSGIGYGGITPASTSVDLLVTFEAFIGLLSLGLVTGLIFARFARPTARILFSEQAVVAPYHGGTAFEFRIVNGRQNQIVQLEARVILTRRDATTGRRIFDELDLERRRVAFFPLTWTVVHPIDESSPLWGLGPDALSSVEAEFLVLLSGFDETFSQVVHSRTSYRADEVSHGMRFDSVFDYDPAHEVLGVDVGRLSRLVPAPGDADSPQPET